MGWVRFQSGISLSICLHRWEAGEGAPADGFCVSIRHQPEYLPSPNGPLPGGIDRERGFQSGISLSICLHPDLATTTRSLWSFQSGISLSICLHSSSPSRSLDSSPTCFNQASA